MSDQNFHEIQLSGKQLVFLFMSAVVLAVVIFLLGVSVGRGVRSATMASAAVDTGAPGDTVVSTSAPPPTQPAPGELSYHDTLQGQRAGGAATPPQTPASPPPPSQAAPPQTTTPPPKTPPPAAAATPPGGVAAGPPQGGKPAEPSASKAAAAKPPASGGWVVQVMALRSKDGADKVARDLKTKGYPAFVVSPASGLFRIRVGPFLKRAEAEQIAGRLAKEGFQSSSVQPR